MKPLRLWMSMAAIGASSLLTPATVFSQQDASTERQPQAATVSQVDPLFTQVEDAIAITSKRYLTAGVHTPWQIMHGILALRQDFQLKQGEKKVSALEWTTQNANHQGVPWFQATQYGGRAHPFTVPFIFEGHPNQFLAIYSMSSLPLDFEFKAGNDTITMAGMIKNAQMDVNSREEITWTLWALSRYLDPDTEWTNRFGELWSMERLVQIQTYAAVRDGACGGTHGLFSLSFARNSYIQTGRPLRGVWFEADQKIRRYVEAARSMQNSDGTFSSNYFDGPGYSNDFSTRLATTGHTLEWLMLALPQDRLNEPWVRKAVAAIAKDLIDNRKLAADCGPLYHALHAMVLYRDRMQPERPTSEPEKPVEELATTPPVVEPEKAAAPATTDKPAESAPVVANEESQDDEPQDDETAPAAPVLDASVQAEPVQAEPVQAAPMDEAVRTAEKPIGSAEGETITDE